MVTVEVVRGGSGRWALYWPSFRRGTLITGGHVPKSAPFEEVCARQLSRQIATRRSEGAGLGGGNLIEITITQEDYDNLVEWAEEKRVAVQKEEQARKSAFHAEWTCPICGGIETPQKPRPGYFTSVHKCASCGNERD